MSSIEYIVKCPQCSAKAVAIMKSAGIKGTYREPTHGMAVRRLLCGSCGLAKDVGDEGFADYELWYTASFRGHRLWAVNLHHLALLISWLSGSLRKADVRFASGIDDPHFGTRVMVERLPKWMVLAKNRSGVLRCLRKMYDT
jgi:hypothetical protein